MYYRKYRRSAYRYGKPKRTRYGYRKKRSYYRRRRY